MLKERSYKFFNVPKKHEISDYKEAISYIIKKYSKINGLLSMYNWGDPSVPGISDIDIVFVLENNKNNALPFLRRSFYFLNAETRYLVRHPFVFIDENSFRNIRHIYPNANFKLLHGRNIRINNLSAEDSYYSCIALLNDIIIRHYPHDFLEQFINKKINVRDTLLRLNSLKYSIRVLERLTKEKYGNLNHKLALIGELRKNWFNAKDFDLLVLLNRDAVKITMEIIDKFKAFLTDNSLIKINSGSYLRYNGIKNKSQFVRDWDKKTVLREMSKLVKENRKFYSILPLELSAQLIEYSKSNGLISSYIREKISNNINYQLKYKKIIGHRINILNKQAELASKLKHSDFVAFFDFGYCNESGINNWILRHLRRLIQ